MLVIQLIISLIPLFIINLFIKRNRKWSAMLNLTFYTIIALIFLIIYDSFIQSALQKGISMFPFLSKSAILLLFIEKLFYTGLPEEIIKYSAIKMSKPKNQLEILNNTMTISAIFIFFENYAYSKSNILVGAWRIILPVHILSQLVMAYYLIKAYEEKNTNKHMIFSTFSIILPVIIHTLYNCCFSIEYVNVWFKSLVLLSFGIIAYILVFKFIKNTTEKYSNNVEENIVKLNIFKIITVILCTAFWIYAYR